MKTPKLNTALLKRVAKAIRAHPTQVNMKWWFQSETPFGKDAGGCGTAGCVAAWIVKLNDKDKSLDAAERKDRRLSDSVRERAAEAIGIDFDKSGVLFFAEGDGPKWPKNWIAKLRKTKTPQAYANVVADRIEYFIEKGK